MKTTSGPAAGAAARSRDQHARVACAVRRCSLTLAGTLALAACSSEPFAYLNGARWSRVEINTYDTIISAVDGRSYPGNRDIRVSPGLHHIEFQSLPAPGFHEGVLRAIDIDIKPCTRYWFEARKENRLMQDFVPAVNYSEPIGGCPGGSAIG